MGKIYEALLKSGRPRQSENNQAPMPKVGVQDRRSWRSQNIYSERFLLGLCLNFSVYNMCVLFVLFGASLSWTIPFSTRATSPNVYILYRSATLASIDLCWYVWNRQWGNSCPPLFQGYDDFYSRSLREAKPESWFVVQLIHYIVWTVFLPSHNQNADLCYEG